jgi:hypothetical protein
VDLWHSSHIGSRDLSVYCVFCDRPIVSCMDTRAKETPSMNVFVQEAYHAFLFSDCEKVTILYTPPSVIEGGFYVSRVTHNMHQVVSSGNPQLWATTVKLVQMYLNKTSGRRASVTVQDAKSKVEEIAKRIKRQNPLVDQDDHVRAGLVQLSDANAHMPLFGYIKTPFYTDRRTYLGQTDPLCILPCMMHYSDIVPQTPPHAHRAPTVSDQHIRIMHDKQRAKFEKQTVLCLEDTRLLLKQCDANGKRQSHDVLTNLKSRRNLKHLFDQVDLHHTTSVH